MKIVTIIARVLLGLMFVVFGLNIFLHFIPMPEQKPSLMTGITPQMLLGIICDSLHLGLVDHS